MQKNSVVADQIFLYLVHQTLWWKAVWKVDNGGTDFTQSYTILTHGDRWLIAGNQFVSNGHFSPLKISSSVTVELLSLLNYWMGLLSDWHGITKLWGGLKCDQFIEHQPSLLWERRQWLHQYFYGNRSIHPGFKTSYLQFSYFYPKRYQHYLWNDR